MMETYMDSAGNCWLYVDGEPYATTNETWTAFGIDPLIVIKLIDEFEKWENASDEDFNSFMDGLESKDDDR